MTGIPATLVHMTATTTGTGSFSVTAVNGKQSFSAAYSTGATHTFDYFASNQSAAEWERGIGYMSDSATLVRSSIVETSGGTTAAINFTAGTKDICNDVPAKIQHLGYTLPIHSGCGGL